MEPQRRIRRYRLGRITSYNVCYTKLLRLISQLPFEGIVPRLNRLFRETTSSRLREEIEGFMTEQGCPACQGARLKPEAP